MPAAIEISTAYARLTLQSKLLSAEDVLHGTGVTEDYLMSADYIDWQILAAIFRNIGMQQNVSPAWAAYLGGQFSANAHGPLGFAALSAPTLGAAVEALIEFYPARVSAITTRLEATGDRYVMHLHDVTGDEDFARSLGEIVLKVVESLLAAILGHPVSENVVVNLMRPATDSAYEFIAAYDGHVRFGASGHSISVPAIWWRLPSPLHDESMYWANLAKCRELIASREQHTSAAFVVRSHLRSYFEAQIAQRNEPSAPPTQEHIAGLMHLTTRTLIRRLKREGSAYKDVLEELRKEYAQALLANARLTVADVGELLGYREPANFGRAFRRWFNSSPAAWRRR